MHSLKHSHAIIKTRSLGIIVLFMSLIFFSSCSNSDSTKDTTTTKDDSTQLQKSGADDTSGGPGSYVKLIFKKKDIDDLLADKDVDSIVFKAYKKLHEKKVRLLTCGYSKQGIMKGNCVITGLPGASEPVDTTVTTTDTWFLRRNDLLNAYSAGKKKQLTLEPKIIHIADALIRSRRLDAKTIDGDYQSYEIYTEDNTDTQQFLFPSPPYITITR